jgi:Retinal pigment epithelial membrane protein
MVSLPEQLLSFDISLKIHCNFIRILIIDLAYAGVVISIVSAKNGGGYALVLDASSFKEVARARFPYGLPYGLHGCWVPRK